MDIEAVLDDGGQLNLKGVVVDGLVSRDVGLKSGGFRPGKIAHGNRTQPQRAQNFLQVGGEAGVHRHGLGDRNNVLLRLGAQGAMVLIRHRVEQCADA